MQKQHTTYLSISARDERQTLLINLIRVQLLRGRLLDFLVPRPNSSINNIDWRLEKWGAVNEVSDIYVYPSLDGEQNESIQFEFTANSNATLTIIREIKDMGFDLSYSNTKASESKSLLASIA